MLIIMFLANKSTWEATKISCCLPKYIVKKIMKKIKNIINTWREVFGSRRYVLIIISVTVSFALFEIWLTNYSLISFVYRSNDFSWRDRISILYSAVVIFLNSFNLTAQIFAFWTAFLVGLNTTFLSYYFKKRLTLQSTAGANFVGMLMSFVGVGCSSCGSVVLSSTLGFATTTKLLSILPLRGGEFSLIAITTLTFSIYTISQKITDPTTCKIKK